MRRAMAALIALAGTTLCGALVFEGGVDPVIFPPQKIPIWFNHDYHVRKSDPAAGVVGEGLACSFCHENVGESANAGDLDIPGHGSCDTCHEEWIGDEDTPAPPKDCARCHRDLDPVGTSTAVARMHVPPPSIVFSHAAHTAADVACLDCHPRVPDKTVATRDDYPTMDRCVGCHVDRGISVECRTCHLSGKTGRLITALPGGTLEPRRLHSFAIHDADFLRDHAVPAKRERQYCESCHQEDFCLECHDGVGRDTRYHPGDFLSTHFIHAKQDDVRCQSCHRVQSFCLGCHVRSGVASLFEVSQPFAPTRRTIRTDARGLANGPHPMAADGWLNPASRNFHGFHAQRNIRACASCHQEQQCLQCHMSKFGSGAQSSFGGNPHGPNPGRLKGSTLASQNARMCLKCHHPADPSWR